MGNSIWETAFYLKKMVIMQDIEGFCHDTEDVCYDI